ncbi:Myelin regulatory factor [Aphelenchoides besseyi]|nr:Myelin regulatory factor [Aphelenchoides besseyi]KAI6210940.1 Myelin regulatory factor [Aphelenchoides besseyi]
MANNNNRLPPHQPSSFNDETGFSDPLGNCPNFNILSFINSSDTPVDSPSLHYNQQQMEANFHGQQHQMQNHQPNQIAGHQQQNARQQNLMLDNNVMYANNQTTRLPDLRPMDGNTSTSPSSSDSAYSPENYANYPMNNGNLQPHNGMILNINDRNLQQQTQISPGSDFLSPYLPQTPSSQVSPPVLNSRNQDYGIDGQVPHGYPMEDLFAMVGDEMSELLMEYTPPTAGTKRRRMADGSMTMVKNEKIPMATSNSFSGGSLSHSPLDGSLDDFDDGNQQRTIKFGPFNSHSWSLLYDQQQRELPLLKVEVVADKGFNYSASDNCFVNQKKNHFQITVLITATTESLPVYVNTHEHGLQQVNGFKLAFCGAKSEMTSSEIQIRQSQSDRRPVPHDPVQINISPLKQTKITVPRLHFSETTINNHRKSKKPNPDQRFFHLVVKLLAETPKGMVVVQSYASDKVIVRASNPGQFEPPENDLSWQKSTGNVLHYGGPVAIGTEKPINDAQLTVMGNIVSTGQHTRPSDRRVKEDIMDVDTGDAMARIANVRIVEYAYKPEMAQQWGLDEESRHRVGVIAQELAEVIPDAVRDNGEFLTVDDTRVFYDTVAAAQELFRLTGNLECKIDQVEKISAKLARYAQKRKQMGSMASGLSDLSSFLGNITEANTNANRTVAEKTKEKCTLDNDKHMLSQSRLSLASSAPSMDASASQIGSASQYGRYYGRKGRRHDDSQLCNSRLTQATMVSLIVIMSICLVTMCTLYVLDWYKRSYDQNHFAPIPMPSNPSEGVGNIIQLANWIPPSQPLVHPLLSTCTGLLGAHCQRFCCSTNLSRTYDRDESANSVTSSHLKTPLDLQALDSSALNVPSIKFDSGVEMKLLELNVTLDNHYCTKGSCNPRRGQYNFYIPISPYFPTIPMHLRITTEPGMYVDACGPLKKFEYKPCVDEQFEDIRPSVNKIDEQTFELSASEFLQSAYRFRIGHSAASCSLDDDQQGRSFDQYNLVFYRKCD